MALRTLHAVQAPRDISKRSLAGLIDPPRHPPPPPRGIHKKFNDFASVQAAGTAHFRPGRSRISRTS